MYVSDYQPFHESKQGHSQLSQLLDLAISQFPLRQCCHHCPLVAAPIVDLAIQHACVALSTGLPYLAMFPTYTEMASLRHGRPGPCSDPIVLLVLLVFYDLRWWKTLMVLKQLWVPPKWYLESKDGSSAPHAALPLLPLAIWRTQ